MSGWDYPRPRIRVNRVKWARRFWLAVPHKRKPYLSLTGQPVGGASHLAGCCRRCGRC